MMPEMYETRICSKCYQIIIHPNLKLCPQCLCEDLWPVSNLIRAYKKVLEIYGENWINESSM